MSNRNKRSTTRRTTLKLVGSAGIGAIAATGVGSATEESNGRLDPEDYDDFDTNIENYDEPRLGTHSNGDWDDCEEFVFAQALDVDLCWQWDSDEARVQLEGEAFGQTYGGEYILSRDEACQRANWRFPGSPPSLELEICANFTDRQIEIEGEFCQFYGRRCTDVGPRTVG